MDDSVLHTRSTQQRHTNMSRPGTVASKQATYLDLLRPCFEPRFDSQAPSFGGFKPKKTGQVRSGHGTNGMQDVAS